MTKKVSKKKASNKPAAKLLSSGNPQIEKGYGDEVVQTYIAAMPDWKHELGRVLDQLITKSVPAVQKGGEVEYALLRPEG